MSAYCKEAASRLSVEGIATGAALIPYARGCKYPKVAGLQDGRALTLEEFQAEAKKLGQGGYNVGLRLGQVSGIVDVDLDSPEARALAPYFLPKTQAVSGRPGAPRSHYRYRSSIPKKRRYVDPLKSDTDSEHGNLFLEVLTDGQQVLVYGEHPNGELVSPEGGTWQEAPVVSEEELIYKLGQLATACFFVRHWPKDSRQYLTLGIVGLLANKGWPEDDARQLLEGIIEVTGDEEPSMRLNTLETTYRAQKEGTPLAGASRILDVFGKDEGSKVLKALDRWLGKSTPIPGHRGSYPKLWEFAEQQFNPLFVDQHGTPSVVIGGTPMAIRSEQFKNALRAKYLRQTHGFIGRDAMSMAQDTAEAIAATEGRVIPVRYRLGKAADGSYWYHLGPETYLRVDRYGQEIRKTSDVLFRSEADAHALPMPQKPGHMTGLTAFRELVPCSDDDWILFVGWLLLALRPESQYMALQISGETGAGKTTLARMAGRLVDPRGTEISDAPTSERAFYSVASHRHVMILDNVSRLRQSDSDLFCRALLGGGYLAGKLYSDLDSVSMSGTWPLVFTSISEITTQTDLLSRSILIHLPTLEESERMDEADLWMRFEAIRPLILWDLFDAISAGLRNLEHTKLERNPRMMSAARWVEAASQALGWEPGTFIRAFMGAQEEHHAIAIEASRFGNALIDYLSEVGTFKGTMSDLGKALDPLGEQSKRQDWPQSPRGMSSALERLAPNLRAMGITLTRPARSDKAGSRAWEITDTTFDPAKVTPLGGRSKADAFIRDGTRRESNGD
jgi:energy-coupling factor transporter ATP-binding protein EcfA2